MYQVEIAIALEPLLDDLAVQHAEKAATEPEAQSFRNLGGIGEAGVIEPELGERFAQSFEIVVVDGIESAIDHRLRLIVAGECLRRGVKCIGHGVADVDVGDVFDLRGEIADLAAGQFVAGRHGGAESSELGHFVGAAAAHQRDLLAFAQRAVFDSDVNDDPFICVEVTVIDEGLQRIAAVAGRRRNPRNDSRENFLHANAAFSAGPQDFGGIDADGMLHFGDDVVRASVRQVDLVEHGHDHQFVLHGQVGVGDGLSLHALKRIDQENRAFAGGETAGDFIAEIDVAGRIDKVEFVLLTGVRMVNGDRVHADGDTAFALQVHGVERLSAVLASEAGTGPRAYSCRDRCAQ